MADIAKYTVLLFNKITSTFMDLFKNISSTEIIIILLLLIVIFGNKRVSDLAKKSGDTIKEAKKIKNEIMEELGDDLIGKPPSNPPQS